MGTAYKARVLFSLARIGWVTLVIAVTTTLTLLGLLLLSWTDSWQYAVFGVVVGTTLGGLRDARLRQAMAGAASIVLLAFALRWSESGSIPDVALPLVGMTIIYFVTFSMLMRIWNREYHAPETTLADLDAVVSQTGMG